MAFKEGDFVKIEYTAWRVADGELLNTTDEKLAKEKGIYNSDAPEQYKPQLIVIGKGDTIKGVEEAVKGMNLNEEKTVEIEPKDAFGERDPSLIKIIPMSEFRRRDIDPYPGMRLDIDGTEAVVKAVNSGRVIVDENNPLAGEKLRYKLKVVEKIDADNEKVKAIAERLGLGVKSVSIQGNSVSIEMAGSEKTAQYEARKSTLPSYIFAYMPNIEKVEIKDIYEKPKQQKQEQTQTQGQEQEKGNAEKAVPDNK